jgi:hypothetical protein
MLIRFLVAFLSEWFSWMLHFSYVVQSLFNFKQTNMKNTYWIGTWMQQLIEKLITTRIDLIQKSFDKSVRRRFAVQYLTHVLGNIIHAWHEFVRMHFLKLLDSNLWIVLMYTYSFCLGEMIYSQKGVPLTSPAYNHKLRSVNFWQSV